MKKENIFKKDSGLRAKLHVYGSFMTRGVDLAEKYLETLLIIEPEDYAKVMFPEEHYTKQKSKKMYASQLNSATRSIHLGAIREKESIYKVHDCFVPLLQQAISKIPFKEESFKKIRKWINRKIADLEENHCCGVFLEQKV